MTHLEIFKEACDKCVISYVVREIASDSQHVVQKVQYLFLCNGTKERKKYLATCDLEYLLRTEKFMEFWDGQVASY